MKRALVRVLYGEPYNPSQDYRGARANLNKDIDNIIKNNEENYFSYVLGESNYKYLKDKGLKNVVLVTKDPYPLARGPGFFLNKVVAWECAMKDFDEVVFLDWDTIQTKSLPNNFWDEFYKKREIQSPLYKCRRSTSFWRKDFTRKDNKRGVSGCFVYMRDKNIPDKLLAIESDPLVKNSPGMPSDETYINRYIDQISEWGGMYKYFDLFEPPWCIVEHTIFLEDKINACFKHPVKGR